MWVVAKLVIMRKIVISDRRPTWAHTFIHWRCMLEDAELKKELEAPKVSYSKMEINLSSAGPRPATRKTSFTNLFCGNLHMSISRPLAFLVVFDVQAVVPNYTTHGWHGIERDGTGQDMGYVCRWWWGGCVPKEIHYKFLETQDSWLCWLEIQSSSSPEAEELSVSHGSEWV